MLKRNNHLSTANKTAIYKQIVRPSITYGCVIFGNTHKTNHKVLQVLQNKFLRLAVNANRYTSTEYMHERMGVPTMREHISTLANRFFDRLHTKRHIRGVGRFTRRNAPFRIKKKLLSDILDV